VDAFPEHVVAFGQTAIVAMLTRYLAEPGIPSDDLAGVLCAFQRLFFHPDAHWAYLVGDRDLIPRIIALLDSSADIVRRRALRTLEIACHEEPEIADQICEEALGAVSRVLESDPSFALKREASDFVGVLIGAVSARQFISVLGDDSVKAVIVGADEFSGEEVQRLVVALERATENCVGEGVIRELREALIENALLEKIAWVVREAPEGFPLTGLRTVVVGRP
jgi:hypothetical protein